MVDACEVRYCLVQPPNGRSRVSDIGRLSCRCGLCLSRDTPDPRRWCLRPPSPGPARRNPRSADDRGRSRFLRRSRGVTILHYL